MWHTCGGLFVNGSNLRATSPYFGRFRTYYMMVRKMAIIGGNLHNILLYCTYLSPHFFFYMLLEPSHFILLHHIIIIITILLHYIILYHTHYTYIIHTITIKLQYNYNITSISSFNVYI